MHLDSRISQESYSYTITHGVHRLSLLNFLALLPSGITSGTEEGQTHGLTVLKADFDLVTYAPGTQTSK